MILQRSLLCISTFVFMILLRAINKKSFAKHSTAIKKKLFQCLELKYQSSKSMTFNSNIDLLFLIYGSQNENIAWIINIMTLIFEERFQSMQFLFINHVQHCTKFYLRRWYVNTYKLLEFENRTYMSN